MYKVSGKVLVKETGVGIPNLQIVLYDIDNIVQNDPKETFSHVIKSGQPVQLFWQNFPGDRLGSVLTAEDGRFELIFEEELFLAREQGKRPDLILFVMAPEDSDWDQKESTDPLDTNSFIPKSPVQRILLYSYDPVANAGKNESYILRIPSQQLNQFGIPYPNQNTAESASFSLISSVEKTRQLEKAVLQHENKYVQAQVSKERLWIDAAKEFVADFSALSVSFRGSPLFAGEAKARNAETTRMKALSAARTLGLAQLNHYKIEHKPQFSVHLTDKQIENLSRRLILSPDGDGYVVGSLCSLLNEKVTGATLQRVRELVEKKKEGALNNSSEGNRAPTNGHGTAADADLTPTEQIQQRVLGQIQHLEIPNLEKGSKGIMNNLLKMLQELKSSSQGPADVAALRDFHSLQIAFPHVWTEAFNGRLREEVERLYRETVRLHEEYGVSLPPGKLFRM